MCRDSLRAPRPFSLLEAPRTTQALSSKKRVYDLAKEYGMTGQELAAKLRDLGFAQVKSHMTALSDPEVLEIQARLEAYGFIGEATGTTVQTIDGVKIKRKKKKPPAEPKKAPVAVPEPEPSDPVIAESSPEAPPEPEPIQAETLVPDAPPVEEPVTPEPVRTVAAADEPVAEVPSAGISGPDVPGADVETTPAAPEPTPETSADETTAPAAQVSAGLASEVPSASPAASGEPAKAPARPVEEPTDAQPAAASASPATGATKPKGKKQGEIVRPSAKRKGGKVVGFIDPSQFQKRPTQKPVSRRLRSSDDVVPDVRPTMGRDRKAGQVRGDTTRGTLTAQQLREREAGRFLRRRRIQQQGPSGGGGGRRAGGRHVDPASGSPYSGTRVDIGAPITLKKLANTLAVNQNQVVRIAIKEVGLGININSVLDEETAVLLANEFDVELNIVEEIAAEQQLLHELKEVRSKVGEENLVQRPPCVAFLGHVDHGKTTLIDTIRRSRISTSEAGGITQHIGAYQVTTQHGHTLTIVDTPGHAAFTAMRARGAHAVDIVVLVVAADDGVKPQTDEALNHAKVAGTPIVVAINKVDKPEANTERVRNELAGLGLTPEEWGGDTAMMEVSGLKDLGIEELLERVFLESEVLELKSHENGPASGVVLEAEIQQGKGKVAHLLIQDGSLKKGDVILAGGGYGKVRSICDDRGKQLKEAGPSLPVEVTGLNELPGVSDKFHVVDSLDRAQEVAQERARKNRQLSQIERRQISHENILEAVADQEKPTINIIVKADMQGSIEVLKQQIGEMGHEDVDVKIVHSGVGAVLESDVDLAVNSDARILAFHTSAITKVRQVADRSGIDIKVYRVIYELLDDIKRLMEGELAPEYVEEITGHVEIRRIFKSSKIGNIGGCYVLDGTVGRNSKVRLLRDSSVVYTGTIGTLRRESDDAKEVREGFECGVVLKDYNDIREGDIVETYKINEIKRKL